MKQFLLILFLLGLLQTGTAQRISINSNKERNFAFEVKQIDEFFERFNDEEGMLIREYVQQKYPGTVINRTSLINSLFNKENKSWNFNDLQRFSRLVTDSVNPVYMDFAGDWCAVVTCRFHYNGKAIDVPVVLKIQKTANGGAKWVIESACSSLFKASKDSVAHAVSKKAVKFLNPISHATDFIGLSRVFSDINNINDYLDVSYYEKPYAVAFLNVLRRKELSFVRVSKISYYFFQVEGWIICVNNFQRSSSNSGWLISNLIQASPNEKASFKQKLYQNIF